MLLPAISGCSRGAPRPPAQLLASVQAQRAGAALYASDCALCHGTSGDGHGMRQNGMSPPPADLRLTPWSQVDGARRTFAAIRQGVPGTAMAPWPTLTQQQIWQLVAYIKTLGEAR
jgi:high-affinity iron transporter